MKKTLFGSRLLALLLTLTMLVSFAGVIPSIVASAADPSFDGYIYNGDFETGTASPWKLNSASSIVEGGHNGSGYAVRFEAPSAWAYFYQKFTVKPDTDYRVTFWVKRVAGTSSHNIYIYDPNDSSTIRPGINGTRQWFNYTGDDWVQHVFEFNSETLTSVAIYFKNSKAEDVFLYDDIVVAEMPKPSFDGYLYNGDFETGDASKWSMPSGASIIEGGHNGSGYAARLAASAPGKQWEHFKQLITVEPNTDYRLSGWVKRVAGTGSHYLYTQGPNNEKMTGINGTKNWFTYMDDDWVYHKWEFNSGEFTQVAVYMMISDSESVFLYDDISVKEIGNASFDGYISNGDFELGDPGLWTVKTTMNVVNGGYNGSEFALRVEGSQWSSATQTVEVEEHTDYRLSAWIKREAGTGAHYLTARDNNSGALPAVNGTRQWFTYTGDEWVQHIYEFNSGSNTQIKIYMQIEDPNSVFLYDDVTLEKLGTASFDGYIANGDFETGRDSGWVYKAPSAVVEGGRNGSAYALSVSGKAGATVTQDALVEGLTDYRITVRAKRAGGSGTNLLSVKNGDTVLEPINDTDGVINPASEDWEEYVFEFNSGKTAKVTVCFTVSDSNTVMLYDDVTMEEIMGPDYSGVLKGDADLDGKLTKDDSILIQQHLDGETTLEGAAAYAADLDYSDSVTEGDLALLRKYLAGDGAAVALYPINGETVAHGSWQVEELLVDYTPGKSDAYSGVPNRKDQYARDPVVLRWMMPQSGARSYYVVLADNPALENAKEYRIQNDNAPEKAFEIQNLMVDTDYYWAIRVNGETSDVGTFHTAKTVRTLWIEGVSNTRDIGGWLTEDGEYRVKYNVAFRGAKFDDVTEAGKQAILDLGIKTDVDLRGHNEGVDEPLADIGITHIFGDPAGCAMYNGTDSTSLERLETDHVKGTVNAIRAFANPENYPAYFHCSYGRDRTGNVAMFLLGLLGVSRDDILKDYEMTFLSAWGGSSNTAVGHTGLLTRTMNWLQDNYAPGGTFSEACEGYLLATGLTAEEISLIRANMLEPVNAPAPVATGIEVTTLPDKTSYLEGKDELDVTGAKLTVYYDDDSSEEVAVTADMVSGFDNTVVGPQTLTVAYGEFTATFDIEIAAKSMTGISVTVLPTKLEYEEGDEFDPTDIEVTAYYNNDTSGALDAAEYEITGFDSAEAGEKTITVSAGGFTDTFAVTVNAKIVRGDIDGDGEITVSDALQALRIAAKLREETPEALAICDVDNDGAITVSDALRILRVAAKITDTF